MSLQPIRSLRPQSRLMIYLTTVSLCLMAAVTVHAREVFYVLVDQGPFPNNTYAIKCYSHSGMLQQTWVLGWTGSNVCQAMTVNAAGNTAWICHPYDIWTVSPVVLRAGGGGGSCTVRTDVYGYNAGLAESGGGMFVARAGIYPMPSRIESYSLVTGAYVDQVVTGTWTGWYTMAGWTPNAMQVVGSSLLAMASDGHVRVLDLAHMQNEPLKITLSPAGGAGLAANTQFLWTVDGSVARAFALDGTRRADQDVTFAGLGGSVNDLKLSWGPDEPNIVVTPATSHQFPLTLVGGSSSTTVTIKNVGNVDLVVSSLGLSDTNNFFKTDPPLPLVLSENQSVEFTVGFTPQSAGVFNANLTINSNDLDSGTVSIALSGEGTNPRFYVDGDVAASGNGQTWGTAFKSISDAVASAGVLDGSELWVKKGTYVPASTIQISKKLVLYGGFAGGEDTLGARNWQANTTTIDGNNSIVCMKLTGSEVTLDGFTVTRGHNTSTTWPSYDGAGILATAGKVAIRNCIISDNRADGGTGAGIFSEGATSLEIIDCDIASNWSKYEAGGIYGRANTTIQRCSVRNNTGRMGAGIWAGYASGISIRDCIITGNTSTLNNPPMAGGGGMYLPNVASTEVVNCLVAGNTGGGIESYVSSVHIINCTVAGNTNGGIISHYSDATPVITNCIAWGNTGYQIDNQSGASPVTTYCDVDQDFYGVWNTGAPDANHNMRKNPLFRSAAAGDYRLTATSPVIGMANSAAAPATDLAGVARPSGGCAMGAYEYVAPPQYALTLNTVGQGGVTIDPPTGPYEEGTVVQLTANPAAGWQFAGWAGDVADTGAAQTTTTMNADKTVTATFTEIPKYTLTVNVVGQGDVTIDPPAGPYDTGTLVNLTANPAAGWQFAGWTGDVADAGAAQTTTTMSADKTVTATFTEIPKYTLTVNVVGQGDVTVDPPTGPYDTGALVNLTANPAAGWEFAGWTGDVADAGAAQTTTTMNADRTVTATFTSTTPPPPNGGGQGGTSNPPGTGTTDLAGAFTGTATDSSGQTLGQVVISGAEPGASVDYEVTDGSPPGPNGGTFAGFADDVALGRTLTAHTTAVPGTYTVLVSITFTLEELAGIDPATVELHVFDEASGTWIPAGTSIGLSAPTGIVGQSGYVYNPGGTVTFWCVRDRLSHFAVGARTKPATPETPPPSKPDEPATTEPEPSGQEQPQAQEQPVTLPLFEFCGLGTTGAVTFVMFGLSLMRGRRR